jgi:DNA-directed RNA polymerase sigma subunit (sigma70/sigma32)
MWRTSLPLFPTDDGWPYPDFASAPDPQAEEQIDLDQLELRVDPHAFADLTDWERFAVWRRYGLDGPAWSMKELAHRLGCSRTEARDLLGGALDKLRQRLLAP